MSIKKETSNGKHNFFPFDQKKIIKELGSDVLVEALRRMFLIRNFEIRAESAYQHGKIGGFFHSYIGQEAIQTAMLDALGPKNWFVASYRCHALALLLGAQPNELMAELYGRATGNALGRGGSMHLYTDRLMGGFGIVGGQIPIATGAAFSIKYRKFKDEVAICFFGDGALAQGAFHESLNLASLWNLPCIYVIENNQWGMGTHISRAICVDKLAESFAPAYGMEGITLDGMDYFNCYAGFKHAYQEVLKTNKPVLIEVITERFKGHSVSDPGLYRTKEQLKEAMKKDPIAKLQEVLLEHGYIDMESAQQMDKKEKDLVLAAMEFADQSPWPDPITLEEDVFSK